MVCPARRDCDASCERSSAESQFVRLGRSAVHVLMVILLCNDISKNGEGRSFEHAGRLCRPRAELPAAHGCRTTPHTSRLHAPPPDGSRVDRPCPWRVRSARPRGTLVWPVGLNPSVLEVAGTAREPCWSSAGILRAADVDGVLCCRGADSEWSELRDFATAAGFLALAVWPLPNRCGADGRKRIRPRYRPACAARRLPGGSEASRHRAGLRRRAGPSTWEIGCIDSPWHRTCTAES